MFWKNFDGVFLSCLEKEEFEKVLAELPSSGVRGHFGGDTTSQTVLRVGYYWPTLFKYAHSMACKCIICQKSSRRVKKVAFPLQHITIGTPFQQWGLDIIGPINLPSS